MCAVRSCSWPSHSAMVDVSTPALRSIIAAVWRSTCIETRLVCSAGHRGSVELMLGETTLDRVACQWSAGSGGEQRVGRQAGALARPYFEDGDGLAGERRDPFLSALAEGRQVRSGAEVHVCVGQSDQLRDAQAGLRRGEQQRVVASSGPGRSVGAVQERLDLLGGQERDDPFL